MELFALISSLHYGDFPAQVFEDAWMGCQRVRENHRQEETISVPSRWHITQLPDFLQPELDKWDPFRLQKAQNLLLSLALINRTLDKGFISISMHPLIHAWIRERQDTTPADKNWITASSILALSYFGCQTWRPYYTHLGPHLQSILATKVTNMQTDSGPSVLLQMFFQCGWLLRYSRDDSRLKKLLRPMFRELGADPSCPTAELLPLYELASQNLIHLGKYKEAVQVLEKVANIQRTALAEDHPGRLVS